MNKQVDFKKVVAIFSSFIILGMIFSFLVYRDYYNVGKIDVTSLGNDKNILFNIDSIDNNQEERICTIRGWAFKKGYDLKTVETYVALKNISTSEIFRINTSKEERNDVTSVYNDSYDYNHSGFISRIDTKALKIKGNYEICILYLSDNNNNFVDTGQSITIN